MPSKPGSDLENTFNELANIGWMGDKVDEGRDCLAYSENEDNAHTAFANKVGRLIQIAEESGLQLKLEVDPFGNSYAVLSGELEREIVICSHLDSVPNGGKFDGVMGVATGLNVLQRFIEKGQKPKKTIKVAAFRSEESSATGHSCLGSSLATGNFDISALKERVYKNSGKSLFDILAERGLTEDTLRQLKDDPYINPALLDEVLEVHIEQSSVLESLNEPIGVVVDGIGGARRSDLTISARQPEKTEVVSDGYKILKITINGKAGHSGGLPMNGEVILGKEMDLRKDALVIAAQFLEKNPDIKLAGISLPEGGSYNVVPRECTLEVLIPADYDYTEMETQMSQLLLEDMYVQFDLAEKPEVVNLIDKNVVNSAINIIRKCAEIAEEMARDTRGAVRATIGKLSFDADGSIKLGIDQRRLDNDLARCMEERIRGSIQFISLYNNTDIREENTVSSSATPLSRKIADVMRRAYKDLFDEKEPPELGSMPGQDAAKVISTKKGDGYIEGGMIFVRSLNGGISHHPEELTGMGDIEKACDLLFETVNRL